ncbi:ATP-dependent DNA helicase CHL1 [Wickerhamiella sorbophila]|uniref:ATP-dependent DNA helicase CHL1 n=1 Tax=Wickerhamiella sorbophila TaxID=45607 RepID=A0A2T0FLD7_9ASCO|nr:ATP-dependent DNA helicase CHL1 [Wickerhamiella sorbophila]PRT55808.1 ATP-dependent DNA helicase CHL1 [Wickerhamiella sorbophila]
MHVNAKSTGRNGGKYNHPYEPYDIQLSFMETLYRTLDSKKVGIFESPTGTGKTLSLICPTLTWVRDAEKRELDAKLGAIDSSKGPEWSITAAKELEIENHKLRGEILEKVVEKARQALARKTPKPTGRPEKRPHLAETPNYLLEDTLLDAETKALMEKMKQPDEDLEGLRTPFKIYFTSRTHSQLSQLIGAVKLLDVPASWSDKSQPVRLVTLGSRKQLCVNPKVRSLGSVQKMNDRCLDLQNSAKKCEYKKPAEHPKSKEFAEIVLADIMDIEELGNLGTQLEVCPYYRARDMVPFCEVIVLPYQLLVQASARQALNLDIADSIVIIDEAHNLIDVVSSLYSAKVTKHECDGALSGLKIYQKRVGSRLSVSNRTNLAQTIKVIQSLASFFEKATALPSAKPAPGTKISRSELFSGTADLVDLYSLQEFLVTSKLAFKVDSYIQQDTELSIKPEAMCLSRIIDFLAYSIDPLADGKLFYDRTESNQLCAHYLLLDPSNQFKDLVDQARCVVLSGGTMEPVNDYFTQLFPYVPREQIEVFSCGHVIPKSSFIAQALGRGPYNVEFEFTFAKRNDTSMIAELCQAIYKISESVPAGVVVFFPSYKYLDQVLGQFKKMPEYKKLERLKKLFTEDSRKSVDAILGEYSQKAPEGALLMAVVGGKMSEGINFSDDLARGVVMVGLPFPNAFSAELIAKRDHIQNGAMAAGKSKAEAAAEARAYYENLSMRAVNQSVGRAIRHIKDYSIVYLLDKRYQLPNIQRKLSGWVHDSLQTPSSFDESISISKKFFESK